MLFATYREAIKPNPINVALSRLQVLPTVHEIKTTIINIFKIVTNAFIIVIWRTPLFYFFTGCGTQLPGWSVSHRPPPRRSAILLKSPKYIYTTNYCFLYRFTLFQHLVLLFIIHTTYCVIYSHESSCRLSGTGNSGNPWCILSSFPSLSRYLRSRTGIVGAVCLFSCPRGCPMFHP